MKEAKIVEYMVPAQSLMGLSSYFAWYYGYGFYGPAKYPLLIYGLTLACHSVAHEEDVASNPNMVLAHRAGNGIDCLNSEVDRIHSLESVRRMDGPMDGKKARRIERKRERKQASKKE